MVFFRFIWPQYGWFIGALAALFVFALVASQLLRKRARSLPGELALLFCFTSVAAVVEWFAFPLLSDVITPFLNYDIVDAVTFGVCLLAELIGVAVAARLIVPVRDGRALAMAVAMLLANVLKSGSRGYEITFLYVLMTYLLPFAAAFLVGVFDWAIWRSDARATHPLAEAGARKDAAEEMPAWFGTLDLDIRCIVALGVTLTVLPFYGFLGLVLMLHHAPSPTSLFFPVVLAWLALAPAAVVHAARRARPCVRAISPKAMSAAAFVVPVPSIFVTVWIINVAGRLGFHLTSTIEFAVFFAAVFVGLLVATLWKTCTQVATHSGTANPSTSPSRA